MSGPSILDKPFAFEPYKYKSKDVIKLPKVKKTEQQTDFLEVLSKRRSVTSALYQMSPPLSKMDLAKERDNSWLRFLGMAAPSTM